MVDPIERLMRTALEIARELPRFVQADKGGIGVLAVRSVLARTLTHLLGRSLNIEDVVDHLEGESKGTRISLQRLKLRLIGAAQTRTAAHRSDKKGAGFSAMQVFQFLDRHRAAFTEEIGGLPRHHPGR